MIKINISKATNITKDVIRKYREPLFKELDIEFMRNINNSDKLNEIENKKQILRDLTNIADNKNINELIYIYNEYKNKL